MELTATKYKQTEVGLIPEDWDVKSLGDIGEVKMCKRIFNYQTKDNGDIPFYKIGTFGKEPDAFISRELYNEFRNKYSFPTVGSVLISAAGTIGRLVVFDGTDSYFQDSNIIWIENNNQVISNEYLRHSFPNVRFQTEGGTIKRLYNNILKSGLFPCPPHEEEQKAIAQVLSDTDALIKALEKKIAKKKHIKEGVMQKLLTPKEHWKVKSFGQVCDIQKGQLITSDTKIDGAIPVIAGGKKPAYFHNKPNRTGKTITISGSGANAGYVSFHNYEIFASDCSTISESKNYSIEYIYFVLFRIQDAIYKMQTGGAQPHIHPCDINPIEFSFPSLPEQKKIAIILMDMDTEISQLNQKLKKYQLAKQGMMQQLITGKIRLA
jgi:type I restriction enzyme, S subunit